MLWGYWLCERILTNNATAFTCQNIPCFSYRLINVFIVCIGTHVCAEAPAPTWKPEVDINLVSCFSNYLFWNRIAHWIWSSLIWWHWLGSEAQSSACLCPCLSLPSTGLWLTQPHSVFNVVTGSQPGSLSKHVTHWDILCFSIFKENGRGACLHLSQHSTVWSGDLEEHQLCQEPHCSTQYLLPPFPSIEYKAAPHTHTHFLH